MSIDSSLPPSGSETPSSGPQRQPEGGSGARGACAVLAEVDLATVTDLNAAAEVAAQAAADGAGLTDADKTVLGTDPSATDSDGDGLTKVAPSAGPTDPAVDEGLDDGSEEAGSGDPAA